MIYHTLSEAGANEKTGGRTTLWMDHWRNGKPNLKVIKAVIQFVVKTGRFQPKAIVEDVDTAEEAGVVVEAEGSDDESVGRSP